MIKKSYIFINKLCFTIGLFLFSSLNKVFGQDITNEIEQGAEKLKNSTIKIVGYISTIVLAIGLVIMVYKVATSDQRSREWVIGWVIAAIIYGIGIGILT